MIHVETQKDGFISTRSTGEAEDLIKEASAALANICEAVGASIAEDESSRPAEEMTVMSGIITLAIKRLEHMHGSK